MTIWSILAAPLRHPRLLIVIGILVLGLLAARACTGALNSGSDALATVADYQQEAPAVVDAPHVFDTASRLYFAASYDDDGQVITLHGYYVHDGQVWQRHPGPLSLDRKYYGDIRHYERKN